MFSLQVEIKTEIFEDYPMEEGVSPGSHHDNEDRDHPEVDVRNSDLEVNHIEGRIVHQHPHILSDEDQHETEDEADEDDQPDNLLNGPLNPSSEDQANPDQDNHLQDRSSTLEHLANMAGRQDNSIDNHENPLEDQVNPLEDQVNPLEEDHSDGSFDDGEETSQFDDPTDDPTSDETGFVGLQITNVESAVAPSSVRSPSPNFEDIVSVSVRTPEKENGHQHQLPVAAELGHFDENQVRQVGINILVKKKVEELTTDLIHMFVI